MEGRFVCRVVFVSADGGFLHVIGDWEAEIEDGMEWFYKVVSKVLKSEDN